MTGMCVCVRELLRERLIELLSYTLRPVSASLHLTPLIIAAREKRYNFLPRHYTLVPDRIPTFFCVRFDSPFNSRSSFLQLADCFPRQMCISCRIDSNFDEQIIHIETNEWRIEGKINHAREIDLHFSIEPVLVLHPESRLTRKTHVRTVSQAFHVAFNQHLPCRSIGWQKRTRETERKKERERDHNGPRDRRVSTFSNARRLVRSMARSDPAALFPVTGTMASNSWGRIEQLFIVRNRFTISRLCC